MAVTPTAVVVVATMTVFGAVAHAPLAIMRAMEEAIVLAEATGDRYTVGMGLMNLCCQYEDRGEFE